MCGEGGPSFGIWETGSHLAEYINSISKSIEKVTCVCVQSEIWSSFEKTRLCKMGAKKFTKGSYFEVCEHETESQPPVWVSREDRSWGR